MSRIVSIAEITRAIAAVKEGAPLIEDVQTLTRIIEGGDFYTTDGAWVHEAISWLISNAEDVA